MPAKQLLRELDKLDLAVYTAVASSPTPSLDKALRRLSDAADYSRISMAAAAAMAVLGGPIGRKAAFRGIASVALTSSVLNAVVKPLARRPRPDRLTAEVPEARHVPMPTSHSFPSGHSAAAFAFATGASRVLPAVSIPLTLLAATVAYSRVHTGVHYPGDTIIGSLSGIALAEITNLTLDRFTDGTTRATSS